MSMNILDNVIILVLIVGAYLFGMRTADRYHEKAEAEKNYALRLQQYREISQSNASYVAPPAKRVPIGQPFMDKLKSNGRAVAQINTPKS